jgi:hypothetical protein
MNVLNTRPMKVALFVTFKKYIDRYIYQSDTFSTLKNAKNIEIMNVLNTRPMKVALRYFKKVYRPIHLSKQYIFNIKKR